MTKLREVPVNGNIFLSAEVDGKTYLLDRLGKTGSRRRPGGKSRA